MTFNELLKETYYVGMLSEAEQKKYYLIQRYYHQVSPRLQYDHQLLYNKGKQRFDNFMFDAIHGPSIMDLIKADPNIGQAYHQPVVVPFNGKYDETT